MTVCYIGTPVTGGDGEEANSALLSLAGKAFCLTYFYRSKFNLGIMEGLASLLMNDWGGYPAWRAGVELDAAYRAGYYAWVGPNLDRPTTWAVIPDIIGAPSQINDALLKEWPHGRERGWPVYHLDAELMQSPNRMLRLLDEYGHACVGWAEKDLPILGPDHIRCQDALWNAIEHRHGRWTPPVHHFRGTQLSLHEWPYASLDGTDVAQNHHRPQNTARKMADRWDAAQCPARWTPRHPHPDLLAGAAA